MVSIGNLKMFKKPAVFHYLAKHSQLDFSAKSCMFCFLSVIKMLRMTPRCDPSQTQNINNKLIIK